MSEENCYRCGGVLQDDTPDRLTEISFFICPSCGCDYARHKNGSLHDRWLMPLTQALYGLIFALSIEEHVAPSAKQMRGKGNEFVRRLLEHIDDELANPKQKLADMHAFVCLDEKDLRAFLGLLARRLRDGKRSEF